MSDPLSAHNAAADRHRRALDAYVSVTTTLDVIQRVVEAAQSGDTATLASWTPILDSKKDSLREVSLLLKEYYTAAYSEQFDRRPVSESFEKGKPKKKQQVDTPFKGSWADTVNKTPIPAKRKWPSLAFPDKVNPTDWVKV